MKHSHDYYAQIFMLLMTGQRGYYRSDVVEKLMADTDAVALVDDFTERFRTHVVESTRPDDIVETPIERPAMAELDVDDAVPLAELTYPDALPLADAEMEMLTPVPRPEGVTHEAVLLPDIEMTAPVITDSLETTHLNAAPAEPSTLESSTLEPTIKSPEVPSECTESVSVEEQGTVLSPGEVPSHSAAPKESFVSEVTRNIPNGKSGQPYQHDLGELLSAAPAEVTGLMLIDDGGTGLRLEGYQLIGELAAAGNAELKVAGQNAPGVNLASWTLRLAIIANPRDLWKTLPSDTTAPYAKADCDVARLSTSSGWRMYMASQRGRSHAHRGGQRDDHGVIRTTRNGWNILAVADGAGSCAFSRQGSLLASTHTVDGLMAYLEADDGNFEAVVLDYLDKQSARNTPPKEWIDALYHSVFTSLHHGFKAICEEAQAANQPVKAFSTTLLLALHKPSAQGDLVITFGIGDGGIAVLETGRAATLMNHVDAGAHAGQTRFLDGAVFSNAEQDFYPRIRIQRFTSLKALVLATDGITDPLFASDNDLHEGESWWRVFDDLAPALEGEQPDDLQSDKVVADPAIGPSHDPLVRYLDFFTPGHHDDRTLAVLLRPQTASDTPSEARVEEANHE